MEFGVHLPTMAFGEHSFSLADLVSSAETAERLGFTTLCANDHLIYSRPWLDSLIALASTLTCTHRITLMTTAALPVVRGPAPLAKALAALDLLSGDASSSASVLGQLLATMPWRGSPLKSGGSDLTRRSRCCVVCCVQMRRPSAATSM